MTYPLIHLVGAHWCRHCFGCIVSAPLSMVFFRHVCLLLFLPIEISYIILTNLTYCRVASHVFVCEASQLSRSVILVPCKVSSPVIELVISFTRENLSGISYNVSLNRQHDRTVQNLPTHLLDVRWNVCHLGHHDTWCHLPKCLEETRQYKTGDNADSLISKKLSERSNFPIGFTRKTASKLWDASKLLQNHITNLHWNDVCYVWLFFEKTHFLVLSVKIMAGNNKKN